jgi:UDP-glucose 4-epimerase
VDNLKDKRILVTGGNGYLGSHLVAALKLSGAKVYVIDQVAGNSDNEYLLDINNSNQLQEVVEEVQPQIIYHLAAILNRERNFDRHDQTMHVNYYGTLNLLKALQNIGYSNFIFTSTSEVYGNNPAPFTENQLPDPCSPYSLSKIYAEQVIKTFSVLAEKNFTILRLFNFFGKNMPMGFFIPQLLHSLQHNIPFDMTGGEQIRDFLFVDDVISAMLLAATNHNSLNEVFNVCSGNGISLKKLALDVKNRFGNDSPINIGKLQYQLNEIWNMVGDYSKIKKSLGFKPQYTLAEAIELFF